MDVETTTDDISTTGLFRYSAQEMVSCSRRIKPQEANMPCGTSQFEYIAVAGDTPSSEAQCRDDLLHHQQRMLPPGRDKLRRTCERRMRTKGVRFQPESRRQYRHEQMGSIAQHTFLLQYSCALWRPCHSTGRV